MSAPRRSELLIDTRTLADLIESPEAPLVLDVRWELKGSQPDAYLAGHVPGAVYVDLEVELCDPSVAPEVGGRHPLPAAGAFERAARRWGVEPDRDVVVMDGGSSMAAARCWWLLRYFGHHRVRVLDSGLNAWTADGRAIAQGAVAPTASTSFTARPGGMGLLPAAQIPSFLQAGVVLDARAAERYRGDVEPVDPVAGHIPGVLNLPTASLADEQGRFLDIQRIEQALVDAGVDRVAGLDASWPLASSCGSGVTAAHQVLALSLTGRDAWLVPESYSWWCRQPDRAVAIGSAP